jgi:hypothetical protein
MVLKMCPYYEIPYYKDSFSIGSYVISEGTFSWAFFLFDALCIFTDKNKSKYSAVSILTSYRLDNQGVAV